jgi:Uma2 family endonuclease
MTTATEPLPAAITEPIPWPLYRMTVEKYEAMVNSGVFDKYDRFHLIDGYLVEKMTKNPPHVVACDLTRAAVDKLLPAGWIIRIGDPVRIPDYNEPEPDIAVVRGTIRDYSKRHPGPSDVAMLVEVADSSVPKDSRLVTVYGAAGIPVYWIVNLVKRQVEVHVGPTADGYKDCLIYRPGDNVIVVIDGKDVGTIAIDDLLP